MPPVERIFSIELINPCDTIVLSIDDSVFKTLPEVSISNYLLYPDIPIKWTDDSIIQKTGPDADICGDYIYELWAIDDQSV